MEEEKQLNNIENKTEEGLILLNYKDLISLYYYESKKDKNPWDLERIKNISERIRGNILVGIKNLENNDNYSDYKKYYEELESETDINQIIVKIKDFLMFLHERINRGEKIFNISEESLKALDYIDYSKPLEEQEQIIKESVKKEAKKNSQSPKRNP